MREIAKKIYEDRPAGLVNGNPIRDQSTAIFDAMQLLVLLNTWSLWSSVLRIRVIFR
jgi:hypothetical protein